MAWKGFVAESKSYMNYKPGNRLKFWKRFPGVYFKFLKFTILDLLPKYFVSV